MILKGFVPCVIAGVRPQNANKKSPQALLEAIF